jgi:putative addiction module antidote
LIVITAKIRRVGNSLAVILPRQTVEALGVGAGTEVVVSVTRGRISIRKLSPSSGPFVAALNKVIRKYPGVLSRLED